MSKPRQPTQAMLAKRRPVWEHILTAVRDADAVKAFASAYKRDMAPGVMPAEWPCSVHQAAYGLTAVEDVLEMRRGSRTDEAMLLRDKIRGYLRQLEAEWGSR